MVAVAEYIPPMSALNGLPVDVAQRFGMPHWGCRYKGPTGDAHELTGWRCAWCGTHASNCHHEPPKGMGGRNRVFHLKTPMGVFVLRPALIALCGTGTTGCHGMAHSRLLRIRWMWGRSEYAEKWWSGHYLSHGIVPHDERLYELGFWVVEDSKGETRFLQGESWS